MARLLLFTVLAFGVIQAASVADDVIRRVETRYNGARTLSLHFVENYSMQGHPRPPEEGTLVLRKEGKMRWDYSRPAGKVFISDGKQVFLYNPSENRVEKLPLRDTEDMRAPLAFLLGHLNMKKEFRDFTIHPEQGGTWLSARSKNDRTPYETLEMLIRPDGSVTQLKVQGRDQSLIHFSFQNEQLNPAVAESAFHFTIPPGAEVVNAIDFAGQDR